MKIVLPEIKNERDIQRECCDWLYDNGFFFWRVNNIPVYGRALPKYTPKGLPDVIVLRGGIMFCLEIKRPSGFYKDRNRPNALQTIPQKSFEENILKNGGIYQVIYSVDEVKGFFSLPDQQKDLD